MHMMSEKVGFQKYTWYNVIYVHLKYVFIQIDILAQ